LKSAVRRFQSDFDIKCLQQYFCVTDISDSAAEQRGCGAQHPLCERRFPWDGYIRCSEEAKQTCGISARIGWNVPRIGHGPGVGSAPEKDSQVAAPPVGVAEAVKECAATDQDPAQD
jgi:hypothetical protein